MLLDIHTHHLPAVTSEAILSRCMHEGEIPSQAFYLSVGIHPWYLTEKDFPLQCDWLEKQLKDSRVIAIGEAGLDKSCDTYFPLQEEAFRYVCFKAEQYGLPLVIHSVRTTAELIALKKEIRPSIPWIIHGFRGKPELASSLLGQGFYLSFGEKYHPEALAVTPSERLLLETDDSAKDIRSLYESTAALRGVSSFTLMEKQQDIIKSLFFKDKYCLFR